MDMFSHSKNNNRVAGVEGKNKIIKCFRFPAS